MNPELKEIAEKAKEDHEKGDLDKAAYESLLSGLVHGGKDFAAKLVESKFSDEISKTAATGLVIWWRQNTTYFLDRGLTLSFVVVVDWIVGGIPSNLVIVLRVGRNYAPN